MHLWQTHLTISENPNETTRYTDSPRVDLVNMFSSPRKFVLEIGCSSGATGKYCKEQFPNVIYWGIEPDKQAAHLAATRLDKVLVGLSDDFVLSEQGILPKQIDGVIIADVIEHMYNPWQALDGLKPYLADNAELITSIPNVRNIGLLNHIASGHFTYQSAGLLDITHIRFFTWSEIMKMMDECGYEVNSLVHSIYDLWDVYHTYKDKLPCTVEYGNISIKNVNNEQDLLGLCALQFYSRAVLKTNT